MKDALIRFAPGTTGPLSIDGAPVAIVEGGLTWPLDRPIRKLAAALFAHGIEAEAIAEVDPGLAAPCRLIRFDTHGTVFVIEEPVPELAALLKLLKLESAVHKQGYEVERL